MTTESQARLPGEKRSGYLPSLDGWRAVAILLVLWIHEPPLTLHGVALEPYQRYGSLGVVLFFAISGVLICSRILEEEAMTGRFSLKRFYIRRLFRIQPAAWVYLAVIGGLTLAGVLHEHWKYWFGALFLYENFLYRETVRVTLNGFFTGHFWTLAVEEHFYLLISLAFFFIRRRRIAIFAGALVLVKIAQEIGMHYTAEPLLRRTYWQIHVLLWPSLAALLLREPRVRAAAVRWLEPRWVFLMSIMLGVAAWSHSPTSLSNLLGWLFTFWIVATMLHPQSWTTRVLELAPLRFLGRISYSLYLWHVLFYSAISPPRIDSRVLVFLSERPWKFVCALGAAVLSYYFIEKPFIRLGHRLAPPATAGHGDLVGPGMVASDKKDGADTIVSAKGASHISLG